MAPSRASNTMSVNIYRCLHYPSIIRSLLPLDLSSSTGQMMPSGSEGVLRPGRVRIVVHTPIPTKGRNADEVCAEARTAIAGVMPRQLVGSADVMAADDK